MPIPFIAIGLGVGVLSIGSIIHSTMKGRKWQRIHNEALKKCQAAESATKQLASEFNQQAEELGRLRFDGMETLREAAEFLKKAKVKQRDFQETQAISDETISHWYDLHHEALKSLGIGVAGIVVTIPIGIAAAAWGEWKAEQAKQKVEAKLKEFARAEAKIQQQSSVMKAGQLRITELKISITEARAALRNWLTKADTDNIEDAHKAYKLATTLAELLEQPVLTEAQKKVLEE